MSVLRRGSANGDVWVQAREEKIMKFFKRWRKASKELTPAEELEQSTVRDEPVHHDDPAKILRSEARFRTPQHFDESAKKLTVRYFGWSFEETKELWKATLEELLDNGYEEYSTFMDAFVRASRSSGFHRAEWNTERYTVVGRNSFEVMSLIHRSTKPMPQPAIRSRIKTAYESDQITGVEFVYVNDKGNGPERHLHRAWLLSIDETGFDVMEARGRRRYLYEKVRSVGVMIEPNTNFDETLVTVELNQPSSTVTIETVTTTKVLEQVTARLKRWTVNRD